MTKTSGTWTKEKNVYLNNNKKYHPESPRTEIQIGERIGKKRVNLDDPRELAIQIGKDKS